MWINDDGLGYALSASRNLRCVTAGVDCDEVACPADVNGDGGVDLNDFFQFFTDFDQSLMGADLTGDEAVDLADYFAFFNSFDSGC